MTKKVGNFGCTMGAAGFGSFSFVGSESSSPTRKPHIYLSLEMGEFCPLHCKHCIYESNLSKKEGRPREDVLRAVEASLPTIASTWVSFSGKEPTAYPDDLERMMSVVRQGANTPTIVMTNGLKSVALLLDVDLVDVSLDGDEAAHDWCRGKGAFVRTMKNVRALVSAGKQVGIIATAMNQTLPDGRRQIAAIGALARQLGEEFSGEDNIALTVSLYYGRPGDAMILGKHDLAQLLDEVRDTGITVRILWTSHYAPDSYTFLRSLWAGLEHDQSGIPFIRDGNLLHLVFNAAQDPLLALRVARRGQVYVGCNHLTYTLEERERFSIGNIFENTLGELAGKVLAGKSWLEDLALATACGTCDRLTICRGGDPLSGKYVGKRGDPYCELLN